jgi:membrane-anchored protein YejM (alkaline phosphatase superfamily)
VKLKLNYLFFGSFLVILLSLHLLHLFLVEGGELWYHWPLIIDVVGQVVLEVALLAVIASVFDRVFPRFIYLLFIFFASMLFVAHLIDFVLVRLMDMSVWFGIDFVKDESWDNFIEILESSSISLKMWLIGGGVLLLVMKAGMLFFRFTEKKIRRNQLYFSLKNCLKCLSFCFLILLLWDGFSTSRLKSSLFENYQKSLPLKETFFSPSKSFMTLKTPLKGLEKETEVLQALEKVDFSLENKPDIFLFIAESLREDFLSSEVAPNLYRFRQDNESYSLSYANSNSTQKSWFSLFYSKFPFYWGEVQRSGWRSGALPLMIFKKMGYKIQVYSSSRLDFYQTKQLLFGATLNLVDAYCEFSPQEGRARWECDAMTFSKLKSDLASQKKGGRLFLIFLEATHFDYSWPKEETLFTPIVDKIDYLKICVSKEDLEQIKNRYRNAIHYVDGLFGDLLKTLNEKNLEDAIVVFTGDHGEEFLEEGRIFHASNLNEVQTRVPIYYRLKGIYPQIHSHMDIFPTLLHSITGKECFPEFLQGSSLLKSREWPFIVSARYNASRSPYEFFIHDGDVKLRARFCDRKEIFKCKKLHILSITNREGKDIDCPSWSLEKKFGFEDSPLFYH